MIVPTQPFYRTTAEAEQELFTGDEEQTCNVVDGDYSSLPPGKYRVIDGELFHVLDSVPPDL